jgi:UDP-arabinose 4-epimerase
VRWGPLVEGDLADRNRLVMALKMHQVAAVMHFAAYAYVGESVADPQCTTATTLEAAYR